jgi:site-specific DNA-adenine methylase
LSLSTAVPKPRPSKWALVTKLVIKNVTSTSGQVRTGHRNEFQMMDEELRRFSMAEEIKKDRIKSMITNLDKVDVAVEDLEESLERLYRRMIQARVSLLNILSLHI